MVPAHTAGHGPMALEGPSTWSIGGTPYRVSATYHLALPEGLQYTIDYELPAATPLPKEQEPALAFAFPLMRHAVESGLYQRTSVNKVGAGSLSPSRIGVALYHQEGLRRRGYAVALSVDEIRQRAASQPKIAGQ